MIPDIDTRKPDIDPQKVEVRAQYIWLAASSNSSIHCNRFPSWSELTEATKQDYRRKATRELRDEL